MLSLLGHLTLASLTMQLTSRSVEGRLMADSWSTKLTTAVGHSKHSERVWVISA